MSSFKRIPPDKCMSSHAAFISTLSQDIIDHCARLFESAYELDAIARPDHSAPDSQLVRKSHMWEAQAEAVRTLKHSASELGALRFKIDNMTKGQFG